jgi:hypothetical protein
MAIMVFVSQHEKIPVRAPRFCVAYQAPHAVAAEASHAVAADGTHTVAGDGSHTVAGDGSHAAPETDPMWSPQTGACFCVEYQGSPPLQPLETNLPRSRPASS